MPVSPTYPGVYVQELSSGVHTIAGVGTSIGMFIGRSLMAPDDGMPVRCHNFTEFKTAFGEDTTLSQLARYVKLFFLNGGTDCYVMALDADLHSPIALTTATQAISDGFSNPSDSSALFVVMVHGNVIGVAGDVVVNGTDAFGNSINETLSLNGIHVVAGVMSFNTVTSVNLPAMPSDTMTLGGGSSHAALTLTASGQNITTAIVNPAGNKVTVVGTAAGINGSIIINGIDSSGTNVTDTIVLNGLTQVNGQTLFTLVTSYSLPVRNAAGDSVTFSGTFFSGVQPPIPLTTLIQQRSTGITNPLGNPAIVTGSSIGMVGNVIVRGIDPSGSLVSDTIALNGTTSVTGTQKFVSVISFTVPPATHAGWEVTLGRNILSSDYDDAYTVIDREVDLFNLLVLPPASSNDVAVAKLYGDASTFCKGRRAFLLMDPDPSWASVQTVTNNIDAYRQPVVKDYSAIFYPQVTILDDAGNPVNVGPAGAMAGVFARIDSTRGVWKAPAGIEANIFGISGLKQRISNSESGDLNPKAVNALRVFESGIVSWGARTNDGFDNSGDTDYKYTPVRRLALYLEESLYRGLKWAVFEPNDEPLWAQIRLNVGAFMHDQFRNGAFQGQKPSDAYFVKCDSETTTQTDRNNGIVNIWVGFAPLKPAEFVILYLQQMAGNIQV